MILKFTIFPLFCILLGTSLVLEHFNIRLNLSWGLLLGLTAILFGVSRLIELTDEKKSH